MRVNNRVKATAFAVIMFLFMLILPDIKATAHAESGRLTFNDPSVQVGTSISVYIYISSGSSANWNVASVDLTLSYDTEYLLYTSASQGMDNLSVEGGNGTVHITDSVNSGTTSFGVYLRFNTLKAGSTKISAVSSKCSVLDRNGNKFTMYYGASSVTIKDKATVATLSSMSIKDCELYPEFSAQVNDYTAYCLYEVTEAEFTVKCSSSTSSYRVSGNTELSVGENVLKVIVTAEEGTVNTYTVTITRLDEGEEIPDEPKIPVSTQEETTGGDSTGTDTINEEALVLGDDGNSIMIFVSDDIALSVLEFMDSQIPVGFVRSTYELDGVSIPCCICSTSDEVEPVFCLKGADSYATGFYYFNASTNKCTAVASVKAGSYSIVPMLSIYECPEGYREGTYLIGGSSYDVFTPKDIDIPNHYIVCAVNAEGLIGLYVYDFAENTLQRYDFMVLATAEEDTGDEEDSGDGEEEEDEEIDTTFKGIVSLLRAVGVMDDDEKMSKFLTVLLLSVFLLMVAVAVLCYVMTQQAIKHRQSLKYNIPASQVHADNAARTAEREKLEKREAKYAKRLARQEKRRAKRKAKAERSMPDTGRSNTEARTAKSTADAIPGIRMEADEEDTIKYDFTQSDGAVYYDPEIEKLLKDMKVLGIDEK